MPCRGGGSITKEYSKKKKITLKLISFTTSHKWIYEASSDLKGSWYCGGEVQLLNLYKPDLSLIHLISNYRTRSSLWRRRLDTVSVLLGLFV